MDLLTNARVYTFQPDRPAVSTLVLDGGRVVAAGGDELRAEFAGARRHDLGGGIVLPGLTDAHLHLQQLLLSQQVVDCEVPGEAECLERVRQRADRTPPDVWIRGHGWNQNEWGGAWPSAAELDAVTGDRPAYLTAKSLHVGWVNHAALRMAGIGASTPDPVNGRIQRDAAGEPTGLLFEDAVKLVETSIPEPGPEQLAGGLQGLIAGLHRLGLTGVHDFDSRTCFQALQLLDGRGDLALRVVKSVPAELLPQAAALGLRTGFGSDFLRVGSVKLFADGALGPHTAAMFEPYVDDPQNRGILSLDAEALFERGRQAAESGLSLAVHAIGDRAVAEVLDGLARLRRYEGERGLPALRHRIEHVQVTRAQDAGRLAELDVIASMQPVHAPSDMLTAERGWSGRTAQAYAWKSQLQHGARLAFGSDAPVESPNPFLGLHAAVTRRRSDGTPGPDGWHPEQRLTVQEALEGFTLGPAYAAGREAELGRLARGYLADLIVLERDPFTCDPDELSSLKPAATMVAGESVWQS